MYCVKFKNSYEVTHIPSEGIVARLLLTQIEGHEDKKEKAGQRLVNWDI